MNNTIQANINNPVFANSYFDGTYDPTQGTVYRTGDVLSNLLDDYTGEEIEFKKVDNPTGITVDGIIYRELNTTEFGAELFKRVFSDGIVDAKWFGAKGDGVADDTIALQRGLDFARLNNITFNWGDGVFKTSGGLKLKSKSITNRAKLNVYNNPEYAITINYSGSGIGDNAYMRCMDVYLPDILNLSKSSTPTDWTACRTGVHATNLSECRIYTGIIQNFREGLFVSAEDGRGNAYNTYYIGHLANNFNNLVLQPKDITSWVNENTFVTGRLSRFSNTQSGNIFRIDTYGGGRFITNASVSITGGGGAGAAGAVNVLDGRIAGITMTNQGTGYTSRPTVTITHDGNGEVLGIARYGVERTTHISLLKPVGEAGGGPDNNRFLGLSIETGYNLELVDRHVYCEGNHNIFDHCRWEGFKTTILIAGVGNKVIGGRGSETMLIYETSGTNWGTQAVKDTQSQTSESTDDINLKLKNTNNRSVLQVFETGNVHNKYQTDQGWTLDVNSKWIRGKKENDIYPRINIDIVNGRINFTNGTVSPGAAPYIGHRLVNDLLDIGVAGANLRLLGTDKKLYIDGGIEVRGSKLTYGTGSPEGTIEGRIGDVYVDNSNEAAFSNPLYAKVTQGVSNDTWRAVAINRRGATSGRMPKPQIATTYFDTTLGKPIWCLKEAIVDPSGSIITPAVWVDAMGTIV